MRALGLVLGALAVSGCARDVVATVDGHPIRAPEVQEELARRRAAMTQLFGAHAPALEDGRDAYRALDALIIRQLLLEQVSKRGIEVSEAEVDRACVDRLKATARIDVDPGRLERLAAP